MRVPSLIAMLFLAAVPVLPPGCSGSGVEAAHEPSGYFSYAEYVDVIQSGDTVSVVTVSPFDGTSDTLSVGVPVRNVVCMASNYVACLSAVGRDSVISAVSGARYISDPRVRARYPGSLYDIGYGATLDLERIIGLDPDFVAAYTVSAAESSQMSRVGDAGIPVLCLYDNFEHHPLARAEYIRLFGILSGRRETGQSIAQHPVWRGLVYSRFRKLYVSPDPGCRRRSPRCPAGENGVVGCDS